MMRRKSGWHSQAAGEITSLLPGLIHGARDSGNHLESDALILSSVNKDTTPDKKGNRF
jgi:hypothetical protein